MAAHCYKRVKKDQLQQINICASVDKILDEEVPLVTHRILAFLLLGVVRIYSKKVDFLYDDCHDVLNKVISFKTRKSTDAGLGVPQKQYHLITLPKSFELDAFDLQLLQDQDLECGNARSPEHAMQSAVSEKGSNTLYEENTAYTPPRDIFSPHYRGRDLLVHPFNNTKMSLAGPEILCRTSFSLDDRMDPMVLDEIEEEQMRNMSLNDNLQAFCSGATKEIELLSVASLSNNTSHSPPSWDLLCGTGFSLEDPSYHLALDESVKDQANEMPSDDNMRINFQRLIEDVTHNFVRSPSSQGTDFVGSLGSLNKSCASIEHSPRKDAGKEQTCDELSLTDYKVAEEDTEHLKTLLTFQEDGPHGFNESVDEAQMVVVNKRKFLEAITPDSLKCQRMNELCASIETPDSMLPELNSPKFTNVQTPASRERPKILKKQKTLCDLPTILPNKVVKSWIEVNPRDLIRQRKKVPITDFQVWRTFKLSHAPHSFIEPLFSGISIDLGSLQCEKTCAAAVTVVEITASQDDIQSPVTHVAGEPGILSPIRERSPEQMPLAPATPVTQLIPLRSHEKGAIAELNILEPSTSHESEENWSSLAGGLVSDAEFCQEANSGDGKCLETYEHSARTRMLGRYLHGKIICRRRKNRGELLNVSRLFEGKTRKEIARVFYEILVLKTWDCINVQQENAYGDILLSETSKLKSAIKCFEYEVPTSV